MNKEQEQEFFNQIEEVLHAHEGTYEAGAWEEFDASRKKNKRKFPFYLWTAVAAAILLVAGFFLFDQNAVEQIHKNPSVVKNENQEIYPQVDTPSAPRDNDAVVASTAITSIKRSIMGLVSGDTAITHINFSPVKAVETSIAQTTNPINNIKPSVVEKTIIPNAVKPVREYAGAYDSLINRNSANAAIEKNASKFTYSLAISPSVSNQKLNFGAGMELSYAITNRLSINSGLIYTALNAKSDGKSISTATASASAVQSPQASLSLTGIELPLGIQYQTNSGYYASAGISAVGLINDKLEYSYLQDNTVEFTEVRAGIATQVLKVVSERRIEESAAPLANYMGFFNFSAGKKQTFGKTNLNIGPFVKIPFSSVSSERIKLLQGGVKLSIDF
jgi:cytoskeletal protein RodZ